MKLKSFTLDIIVPKDAIDNLGHVNNVIYLEWVQMISQEHWVSSVSEELRKEGFWVVLNHFIEYKNSAFEGDELQLKTWVNKMEGVRSERHVSITRIKDDKLIAKAVTLWCFIEPVNHRPKRISPELTALFK